MCERMVNIGPDRPRRICSRALICAGVLVVTLTLLIAFRQIDRATTATTSATAPSNPPPPPTAVVPFELLKTGHIALMAKINGKGPFRFIFDTGAPALLIGETAAKASGVLPEHYRKPFFTVLGNLGNHPARSIELGTAQQQNLMATVWNHPTVALIAKSNGPLNGLIGFPFFAHFRLTLDYRKMQITLMPSTFHPVDTEQKIKDWISTSDNTNIIAPAMLLGLQVAKDSRDIHPGLNITNVFPHGPAADAGIAVGDRLLTLNNRWTDTLAELYTAAANIDPGSTSIVTTLARNGHPLTVSIPVHPGI